MVVVEYGQWSEECLVLTYESGDVCFVYSTRYDLTPRLGNEFVVLFGLEAHANRSWLSHIRNYTGNFMRHVLLTLRRSRIKNVEPNSHRRSLSAQLAAPLTYDY